MSAVISVIQRGMSEHFRFKYIIEIKKEKDVKKMN
jgi:hypothetical protein